MSVMLTPHIAAPPLPQTLELDHHTRQFFNPADWSAPVQANFKLTYPTLADIVFIGRVARFCTGAPRLIIQRVSGEGEADAKAPILVSVLALPFTAKDLEEDRQCVAAYFARYLKHPDAKDAADWRDVVPTLGGSTARQGFARLHFDEGAEVGLQFLEDGCNLISFRDRDHFRDEKRVARELRPHIDLGDILFGWEEPQDPIRDFVEMDDASFHARATELLGDPDYPLYHSVAFYRMDMRERCRHVFGCEGKALRRAKEMLRLALTLELGVGGALEEWTEAKWRPWAEEEVVEGVDEEGQSVYRDVPESLQQWLGIIGKATGCKVSEDIRFDEAGLHGSARTWAGEYLVSAQRPSGHELVEASLRLREMLAESNIY